jgi:hypothetical protein
MRAKFYENGKVEITNENGEVIASGKPQESKGDFGCGETMDYVVSLMKFKGLWPMRPWKGQVLGVSG